MCILHHFTHKWANLGQNGCVWSHQTHQPNQTMYLDPGSNLLPQLWLWCGLGLNTPTGKLTTSAPRLQKRATSSGRRKYRILTYRILSPATLSYILSYPVLSCPIISHRVLSFLSYPIRSDPVLSCPVLAYPIPSCSFTSHPSHPVLPRLVTTKTTADTLSSSHHNSFNPQLLAPPRRRL